MKISVRTIYVTVTVIASLLMASCGATIKESIPPIRTENVYFEKCPNPVIITNVRRVAILPLSDYSYWQGFVTPTFWGGNLVIQEEIIDQMVARGLTLAHQDDVYTSLIDMGIMKPLQPPSSEKLAKKPRMGTVSYELAYGGYSEPMNEILVEMVDKEPPKELPFPFLRGPTTGLSKENIVKLSEELKVDMVIRGRILEYGVKKRRTFNPLFTGIIPFVLQPIPPILFGATPEGYEKGLTAKGLTFASEWILTGHKHTKNSTIVQIRLYAQDARTGDMLWTNRTELEYIPNSPFDFDATHPKSVFRSTARRAVKILMGDLFKDEIVTVEKLPEKAKAWGEERLPGEPPI